MGKAISDNCDPLNRLPIELVIQIFDYLHPFDVWSLRRICHRWNEQLSSAQLMRAAVDRFATEHPADSALDTRAVANPSLELELRHILALRLALPFTYVSFPGDALFKNLDSRKMPVIQLKGRYLAHLRYEQSIQGQSVMVRDLVSGHSALFRGQARESLLGFALSTAIIAFVTYTGTLYVASLGDLAASPSLVRLPSSSIFGMAANGSTVAVLLLNSLEPFVVIYNAGTRKSNSFALEAMKIAAHEKEMRLEMRSMAVDEERGTIDFAAITFTGSKAENGTIGLSVMVFRFSLAGEYVTHTAWDQQVHGLRGARRANAFLGPLQATGERGLLSMELSYEFDDPVDPSSVVLVPANLTLLYDEDKMSLKAVHWMVSRHLISDPDDITRPVLWKDRLYRATFQAGPVPAFCVNSRSETGYDELDVGPHALTRLKDHSTDPPALEPHVDYLDQNEPMSLHSRLWPRGVRRRYEMGQRGCSDFLVMNDSFVVTVSVYGEPADINVACFDERIKLHGAESTKLWEHGAKSSMRWDNDVSYILPSSG
jgi:hypothetical protein